MSFATAVIFGAEAVFSLFKSALLSKSNKSTFRKVSAVVCFIVESLLGFILALLLAAIVWNLNPNIIRIKVARAGVIIVL